MTANSSKNILFNILVTNSSVRQFQHACNLQRFKRKAIVEQYSSIGHSVQGLASREKVLLHAAEPHRSSYYYYLTAR